MEAQVNEKLEGAVAVVKGLSDICEAEICGTWLWVTFPDKPDVETRQTLKDHGFRWARKKEKWYFAGTPGGSRRGMDMAYIRGKYGSERIDEEA